MADSHIRLIGRGLGVLAAASLLAGVSLDAAAYGSKGRLELQTGKSISAFHVQYQQFVNSSWMSVSSQAFATGKGCTIFLNPVVPAFDPAYPSILKPLVTLAAKGGRGDLGYVATSIGVFDGPQGTACGRVSFDKGESLTLALGDYLEKYSANAFDRLELDLEVKGDTKLRIDVMFNGAVTNSYYLLAGAAVVGGSPDQIGKELTPLDNTYKCSASSDSGPDAGASDNCRLIINDIGDELVITPEQGEISLEGGGDFGLLEGTKTYIFLTEADGIFDCGDTAISSDETMSCSVTRLDPGGTKACVPVPYVFRTGGGSCELTVDPSGQQIVANLFVAYQPEDAPAGSLSDTTWPDIELSLVSFADDAPNTTHPIPACLGTTIRDILPVGDSPDVPDGDGQVDPIPEIAAIAKDSALDRVKGNNSIDFACAYERSEVLETNTDLPNQLLLYISERIQFWGDIKFERF